MSHIATNTDTTALQSLLNVSGQNTKTSNANFAQFFETNTTQAVLSTNSTQQQYAIPIQGKILGEIAPFTWLALIDYSTTSSFSTITVADYINVSVSNLLMQESDSTLPLQAFLASELSQIDKEQLEAISKDTLKTELEAKDGFKTIFFRDAQSFEFTQDILSEASIQALKDEFGEESFLEREDGSLVLTGKAEKFVSGWQKALSEANLSEISLDTLISKDANFDGTLNNSKLSTSQSVIQITQETLIIGVIYVFRYGSVWYGYGTNFENLLADFHALAAGFAFENLSTTSKTWLEENFPQLFTENSSENSQESASDETSVSGEASKSTKEFNKAKFDEFYAGFKASFEFISASFMGLKSYQTNSSSFEKLSSVVSDLAQNFTSTQKA